MPPPQTKQPLYGVTRFNVSTVSTHMDAHQPRKMSASLIKEILKHLILFHIIKVSD